jgi:hypothetical protein
MQERETSSKFHRYTVDFTGKKYKIRLIAQLIQKMKVH